MAFHNIHVGLLLGKFRSMKNMDNYKNSKGEIWLNVASSTYVLKDFVNFDNNIFLRFLKVFSFFKRIIPQKYWETIDSYCEARKTAILIRHDCRNVLFLPDNSVDHILCSHFLEHVYPADMEKIINDFYRVMKPKATLHIIVPDLKVLAEKYLIKNRNADPLSADEFIKETLLGKESRGSFKYRLLEFHGGFGLQHKWMYDFSSMSKKLQNVGFKILDENKTPSNQYRLDDGSVHVVAYKE